MISKELLKQILAEQRESVLRRQTGVPRDILRGIAAKRKLPHVMVLTGMRRSGKSTLLRQIIANLYPESNFYYINFEDERLSGFSAAEFNTLYELQVELFGIARTFYIDEIQNVNGFEKFIRRFYDDGFKFYVTGSNAKMLSTEIGTKLTGRHIDADVRPFSFREYLTAKGYPLSEKDVYTTETRAALKKHFNVYLLEGGMPEYVQYKDAEILRRVYDDIIVKDIVVRYSIDDVARARKFFLHLVSNFGQKFSYNKLKNLFEFGHGNTVKNYAGYLEDAFLIRVAEQFHFSSGKRIVSEKKVYPIDNGLIRAVTTRFTQDKGWFLENLVFGAFPRRENLYYFSGERECDVLAVPECGEIHPVQAAWELTDANTEREVGGIAEAMEACRVPRGTIVTYDTEKTIRRGKQNIKVVPAWKWLLERDTTG